MPQNTAYDNDRGQRGHVDERVRIDPPESTWKAYFGHNVCERLVDPALIKCICPRFYVY